MLFFRNTLEDHADHVSMASYEYALTICVFIVKTSIQARNNSKFWAKSLGNIEKRLPGRM